MIPRTSEDVKKEFEQKGISISAWALANGFSTNLVFEVLAGRKKGVRGQSHKIAVKLGLKRGKVIEDSDIAIAINA
ncbi:MAG: DNA-binding protein [Desulfovibrionaceae bacterium]